MHDPAKQKQLHATTLKRLEEIAAKSPGTIGLCAFDLAGVDRFEINADMVMPQASAIKIPILMEVHRQVAEGRLNFSTNHLIRKGDKTPGSGVLNELGDDTVQMSLRDLAILMITVSDNTATNMLIEQAGMDNVNALLESLGLRETRLRRRMMDLDAIAQGRENTSTPAEAAGILEKLYHGKFISREICEDIMDILKKPKITAVSAGLPTGTIVAGKPGGIPGAKTEWAIVLHPGVPYVLAVMQKHPPAEEPGEAIREISTVLYEHFDGVAKT